MNNCVICGEKVAGNFKACSQNHYLQSKAFEIVEVNPDHALIKQLGEALEYLWVKHGDMNGKEHDAVTAYNNWKRERGG